MKTLAIAAVAAMLFAMPVASWGQTAPCTTRNWRVDGVVLNAPTIIDSTKPDVWRVSEFSAATASYLVVLHTDVRNSIDNLCSLVADQRIEITHQREELERQQEEINDLQMKLAALTAPKRKASVAAKAK